MLKVNYVFTLELAGFPGLLAVLLALGNFLAVAGVEFDATGVFLAVLGVEATAIPVQMYFFKNGIDLNSP